MLSIDLVLDQKYFEKQNLLSVLQDLSAADVKNGKIKIKGNPAFILPHLIGPAFTSLGPGLLCLHLQHERLYLYLLG